MTHPKDPRLNGWKYKTFNLNDEEHASVVQMYKTCSKRYGITQKQIFKALIKNLYYNKDNMSVWDMLYDDEETK
tara:strand:+ start:159 stop:380 length:222 start_codon:yes stop_codon:yes gene_type:complete